MKTLIFGASGYVGRQVTAHLAAAGHDVTGFVRREDAVALMTERGAQAQVGAVTDADLLNTLIDGHDAIVWIAQLMLDEEQRVVRAMLERLRGSGKAFIFTSGTSLLSERTDGEWIEATYAEWDSFIPRRQVAPRLAIENMVREAGKNGIRAMVIRPPLIWGYGGSQVIADYYHSAAVTGAVCHVGRGLNVYSNVHVDDLADLYERAIEQGAPGALYHCVAGETNFRSMAERIARTLGVGTRSVSVSEAIEIWDKFTGPIVLSSCSRTRSPRARLELGWSPRLDRSDILEECEHPAYRARGPRALPAHVSAPAKGA